MISDQSNLITLNKWCNSNKELLELSYTDISLRTIEFTLIKREQSFIICQTEKKKLFFQSKKEERKNPVGKVQPVESKNLLADWFQWAPFC